MRHRDRRIQTQAQRRRAQFAAARPGHQRHRKRSRHHHGSQGQGRPAAGGKDDHAGQATTRCTRAARPRRFSARPASVQKLFDKLGTQFGQRNGGYTRIVRLGWRKGDGAELPSWSWWAPNWSSAPPNAPSAAKNASRQFKKAAKTKRAKSQKNHSGGDQADRRFPPQHPRRSGSGHKLSLPRRSPRKSTFPSR